MGNRTNWRRDILILDKTLDYYNKNALNYTESTVSADMTLLYTLFLKHLNSGAHILDLGCGSGRDSKYFIDNGYIIDAVDGSHELCKIASEFLKHPVRQLLFQELDYIEIFDAVWACATLLHIPKDVLPEIFHKIYKALKSSGILYVSFKYGNFSGIRNSRLFTDLDEAGLQKIINEQEFNILEICISNDVRHGRSGEKWLNAILQKN